MEDGLEDDAPRQAATVVTGAPAWVYWGGLTSRTHLLYGSSWIRRRAARGRVTVVVEDFGSFLGHHTLTWGSVKEALAGIEDVELLSRQEAGLRIPTGCEATYLTVGAPGIKPLLRLIRTNGARQLRTVITDEGFSSYGTWRTRRASWLREGRNVAWATSRALLSSGITAALRPHAWLLHTLTPDGWHLNSAIASEFRRRVVRDSVKPVAVFCSQPWVELGLLGAAEYTDRVLNVAETCRGRGLDFVLRPHPVEDVSRYAGSVAVATESSPAELDPVAVNAAVLLGASSSALINLSAIHGVPVVRVTPPRIASLDASLSRVQRDLLSRYLGPETPLEQVDARVAEAIHG